MVFNRAGKETYFFLFQPRKGKAHESPFQEVLPKLATLRKKVQRDLLKFLCVRYLLQNYRAGAHQETFQCAKAACSRAQWGLCHCDFFVFVRKHTKGEIVYKCVCVSEHHISGKFWALVFPQTPTRLLLNPFSQPALHSTSFFPLTKRSQEPLLGIFCIFAVVTYAFTQASACWNMRNLCSITELQPVGSCHCVTPP